MILLHLLEEEDKYGYQLSQDLEKQSEGEYQLNEATMYPTLYRLKKNGFLEERKVQVVGKRFRVYYHLTESGKQHLEETKVQYKQVCASIEKVMSYRDRVKAAGKKANKQIALFRFSCIREMRASPAEHSGARFCCLF